MSLLGRTFASIVACVAWAMSAEAQLTPNLLRSYVMQLNIELDVGGEALRLERSIQCDLYLNRHRRSYWERSPQVVGQRLQSGIGIGVVVPNACEFVEGNEERIQGGTMPPDYPGIPPGFVPAIIVSNDTQDFESLLIFFHLEAMQNARPQIKIRDILAKKVEHHSDSGRHDPFSWMRFSPADGRPFTNQVQPKAAYYGWRAVRFPRSHWEGSPKVTEILSAYHVPQFIGPSEATRYENWPKPPSGITPPEIETFLGGKSLPPCGGPVALAYLCISRNTFGNLIPLKQVDKAFELDFAHMGALRLYKFPDQLHSRSPWFPSVTRMQEFVLRLDGTHKTPGEFGRLMFYRPKPAEMFEIVMEVLATY